MSVYILRSDSESYQSLIQVNEDDLLIHQKFKGERIRSGWLPLKVEILYEPEDEYLLPAGDFTMISAMPIFSQKAVEVLDDVLLTNGELLPLSYAEGVYYAFNITTIVDVLDLPASEVVYFPDSERVMTVRKYRFRSDQLVNLQIFKLPQLPISPSFVTEDFVKIVEQSGLTGFRFKKL